MASTFFKTKGLTTHSWPCLPQLYIKIYINLKYVLASTTTTNHSVRWESLTLKRKWELETETAVRLNYEADKKPVVTGPNHWAWDWAAQAFPRIWSLNQSMSREWPDARPGRKNRLERLTHTFFCSLQMLCLNQLKQIHTHMHTHTCAVISNVTQITRMIYSLFMLFTQDRIILGRI